MNLRQAVEQDLAVNTQLDIRMHQAAMKLRAKALELIDAGHPLVDVMAAALERENTASLWRPRWRELRVQMLRSLLLLSELPPLEVRTAAQERADVVAWLESEAWRDPEGVMLAAAAEIRAGVHVGSAK